MPVTTDTLRSMPRMNVLFALSSLLLLVTIVWFAWEDYDRPWREFQNDYMVAQAAIAHLDYLRTQQASEREAIEKARNELAEARDAVDARAGELAALQAEREELKSEHDRIKLQHGNADAVLQVTRDTYEKVLNRYGPEDERTIAAKQQMEDETLLVDGLRIQRENNEDKQRAIERKIKAIREPVTEAQRVLDELLQAARDAARKEQQYGSVLLRKVLNAPFIDFAAPKGTPARHEIKQLVLPEVRQELNYLESYTTDRCITCHVAIGDRSFSRQSLVERMESSLPAINEELARAGKKPLTYRAPPTVKPTAGEDEAPEIKPGTVAHNWERLSREQRSDYFEAMVAQVNEYLKASGRKEIRLRQPLLAHPDLDLYVNVDSPHPMTRMGCTVCHEGNPQETDFTLAAHSPADHHQEQEWKEKYYDRILGIPTATFELVSHYWDRPMLPLKYVEASCGKCHTDTAQISSFDGQPVARRINRGRMLFTRAGCINCHNVDGLSDARRVGPELTHIAAKLEPGFTQQWIYNPRGFRASTWMPHIFNQENNGQGSENRFDPHPVMRSKTEVDAIAHYLFSVSTDWEVMEKVPEGLTGDAENGAALFKEVGCLGCHAITAEYGEAWITRDMEVRGGKTSEQAKADFNAMAINEQVQYAWDHFPTDIEAIFQPEEVRFDPLAKYNPPIFTRRGPELSAIGTKTSLEWVYAWLLDPQSYHSETRMPRLRLSEQEALDIATYLVGLKNDAFDTEPFTPDQTGEDTLEGLVFTLLSGQQSEARSRLVALDDNGALEDLLINAIRRSPVADVVEERIRSMPLRDKQRMYLGSKMITHYGCYACHRIPGFETASRPGTDLTTWAEKPIAQLDFAFYDHAFDEVREANEEVFAHLYPPHRQDLVALAHGRNPEEEVTHTHAAFAYHKIRNPRIWDRNKIKKPYEKLKMPNFFFNDADAKALVTFLMGRKPPRVTESLQVRHNDDPTRAIAAGRHLTRELNCVGCHQVEDNAAVIHQYFTMDVGGRSQLDEVNAPPSLQGEGAKVQPAWFYGFLSNVEPLRPGLKVRMPSFYLSNGQGTTLVEYFAGLAQAESDKLERYRKRVLDYIEAAHADLKKEAQSEGNADGEKPDDAPIPGGDWFLQPNLERSADFLAQYAIEHRLVSKYDLDETETEPKYLMEAYHNVLERTGFLSNLYDVEYPFTHPPRGVVPPERYQLGQELFFELKCLQCHVFGDPEAEGANPNPTAPNLSLVYRRLEQHWVREWMKAPAWIQPGTKMPQLFPDLKSAFQDFGDARAELEAKYGKTGSEQIELLLDFLYNAGMKNATIVQPGGIGPAAPAATEEEFFEEGATEEEFMEDEAGEEEFFEESEGEEEEFMEDDEEEFFEEDEDEAQEPATAPAAASDPKKAGAKTKPAAKAPANDQAEEFFEEDEEVNDL